MDCAFARLKNCGTGLGEGWHWRVGPVHFSHVDFGGTFRFVVERVADVMVERPVYRHSPGSNAPPCNG